MARYRTRIKPISLFFIVFSVFILLNACIGWSSSPFYDKYTECSAYDTSEDCEFLKHRVTALYFFEIFGSVVLVVHGLMGMVMIEYMQMLRLIKIMNTYTKFALGFYSLCVLLRTSMYLKVLVLLAPLELNKAQSFGGFLAVYAENDTLATIITIILMLVYASCFASTVYLIFVTKGLAEYTEQREEEAKQEAQE